MNAVISLQIRPDGDAFSLGLIGGSAAVLFIGTGYIALDTAFDWSGEFVTRQEEGYRNYALYVLYQLFPLICLVLSFLTYGMTCLVMLGEFKPFYYLVGATIFFAIGQVFQYVVSDHLCNASHGKVNGALFETFFTMLALASIWFLWNELTEDQFQIPSVVDA
ncbi:hypothetical protein KEM55_003061 [Ascosphaera atra]|nr:hypothetical protein KEM55_003061 [Ascosphaera atra]